MWRRGLALTAVVVALTATLSVTAAQAAVERKRTGLTLTVPATATPGSPLTIKGVLKAGRTPLARQPIKVQARVGSRQWRTVRTGRTNRRGAYRVTVDGPSISTAYRASFRGTKKLRASVSRARTVKVSPSLPSPLSGLEVTELGPDRVGLTFDPPAAGTSVVVRVAAGTVPPQGPTDGSSVPVSGGSATADDLTPASSYAFVAFVRSGTATSEPATLLATTLTEPGTSGTSYVTAEGTIVPSPGAVIPATVVNGVVRAVIPASLDPTVGDPVVLPISQALPGGFVGRIETLAADSTATLSPISLAEAFDYLTIRVPDLTQEPTARISTLDAPPRVAQAVNTCESSGSGSVSIDPGLAFSGDFDLDLKTKEFLGTPVGLGLDMSTRMAVTVNAAISAEVSAARTCTTSLGTSVLTFQAGPVPMMLRYTPTAEVSVSGKASVRNAGFSLTGGFQADAHLPLVGMGGSPEIDVDLIKSASKRTPTINDAEVAVTLTGKVSGALAVGPGVGSGAVGVQAGLEGSLVPISETLGVTKTLEGDVCLSWDAGGEANIDLFAKAWLGPLGGDISEKLIGKDWSYSSGKSGSGCAGGGTDDGEEPVDTDGDGTPNNEDTDKDGDGVPDTDDSDMDGDGQPNDTDTDTDGDGDGNGTDSDIDGDGNPNGSDEDADGDGTPNGSDEDADGDGTPNGNDSDSTGAGNDRRGGGSSSGDPHLVTIDGVYYDFQAQGEFVAVESTTDDFAIHYRYRRPAGAPYSLSAGAAMRVGESVLTVADVPLTVIDGETEPPEAIWELDGDPITPTRLEQDLPGGATIEVIDSWDVVTWPDGSQFSTGSGFGVGNTYDVYLSDARAGEVVGLMGNHDGDPENDLLDDNGDPLSPYDTDAFYESFGPRVLVAEEDSLFTDQFPVEWPTDYYSVASLGGSPDDARATCRAAGVEDGTLLEACVFDVLATGDPSMADYHGDQRERTDVVDAAVVNADEIGMLRTGTTTGTLDVPFEVHARDVDLLPGNTLTITAPECPAAGSFRITLLDPAGRPAAASEGSGCGSLTFATGAVPGRYSVSVQDAGGFTGDYQLLTQIGGGADIPGACDAPTVSWTGAVNNSFQVAGNWSTGAVPGQADAVCITGDVGVLAQGDITVGSIEVGASSILDLGASDLVVAGAVSVTGTLELGNGAMVRPLGVNGAAPTLNIAASGRVTMTTTGTSWVQSMPVVNAGVVSAQSGELRLSDVATSGTFTSSADGAVVLTDGVVLTGDTSLVNGQIVGLITSGDFDLTLQDATLSQFAMTPGDQGTGRLVLRGTTSINGDLTTYPGIEVVIAENQTLDLVASDLVVAGTVSVTGTLELGNGAMVRPLGVNGAAPTLNIAASGRVTMTTTGTSWVQSMPVVNAGVVSAQSGELRLSDVATSGTFTSSADGAVALTDGVVLTGDTSLVNGQIVGLITSGDFDLTLQDATLSQFAMTPGDQGTGRLVLRGTTSINGDLTTYPGIEVVIAENQTLDLVASDLVVAGTVSVTGTLELGNGAMVRPLGVNGAAPTLNIAASGRVTMTTTGTSWVQSMPVVNAGVVSAQSGELRLSDVATSGTFTSSADGAVALTDGVVLTGDTSLVNGQIVGLITSGDFDLTLQDATLSQFAMTPGDQGTGRLVLRGTTSINGDLTTYPGIEVVIAENQTLDLVASDLVVAGTVSVTGTLELGNGAMVRPLGVNGAAPTLNIAASGRVTMTTTGTSWIQSMPFENAGTVEVASGGELRVDAIDSTPDAVLTVHLDDAGVGRLIVAGAVTLDGTLALVRDGDYAPGLGSVFTVLTASQVEGTFAGIDGASAGGGNVFTVVYDDTTVSVEVIAG